MSVDVMHHLIVFDKVLCDDQNLFPVLLESFKSNLLISNHYAGNTRTFTLGISIIDIHEENIEIRPILSPIVPASSTVEEIIASVGLIAPKEARDEGQCLRDPIPCTIEIEWENLVKALMPHVRYQDQEGFRISLISKRILSIVGYIRQPNCLSFQVVIASSVNTVINECSVVQGPLKIEQYEDGLQQIDIPPLSSEWDVFFRICVFDPMLCINNPIVIHFSTSMYSKLIICCNARLRSLNVNGYNGCINIFGLPSSPNNAGKRTVFETVERVKKSGICQSLVGAQPIVVVARDFDKQNEVENKENRMRFSAALKTLDEEDMALVVRLVNPQGDKNTIRRYFALIPNIGEGLFLMLQVTPEELVLPDPIESNADELVTEEGIDKVVQLEVVSALKKIESKEFYDPYAHSCGIVKLLESKNLKTKGKVSQGGPIKEDSTRDRGGSSARGRGTSGRSRGRSRGSSSQYNTIVRSVKL